MIDLRTFTELIPLHKTYIRLEKRWYLLDDKFERITDKADFYNCVCTKNYVIETPKEFIVNVEYEDRYKNCAPWCKYKDEVQSIHSQHVKAGEEYENFGRDIYEKNI